MGLIGAASGDQKIPFYGILRRLSAVMGKHPDLMVGPPTPTIFPTIGRNFEIS